MKVAATVTEKQFQEAVQDLATVFGWLAYHTHFSLRSAAGFPDLVLVRADRLVFIELKTEDGRVTVEQAHWMQAIAATGAEVYLFRPSDWDCLEETLRRRERVEEVA